MYTSPSTYLVRRGGGDVREQVEGHVLLGGPPGEEMRRAHLFCGGVVLVWFVCWTCVVWCCVVLCCVVLLNVMVRCMCWFGLGFVWGVHICRCVLVWCGHMGGTPMAARRPSTAATQTDIIYTSLSLSTYLDKDFGGRVVLLGVEPLLLENHLQYVM